MKNHVLNNVSLVNGVFGKDLVLFDSVKTGEIVLDPMCGSGTLNVEASLIGIDSIGLDVSPFCRLMTCVKCQSFWNHT